jgi:hypothetical protein
LSDALRSIKTDVRIYPDAFEQVLESFHESKLRATFRTKARRGDRHPGAGRPALGKPLGHSQLVFNF